MKALSQDLRDRVLAALDAGGRTGTVAAQFAVSPAWVRRLKQRRAATGETTPRSRANHRVPFHRRHAAAIHAAVAAKPGRTLAELKAHLGVPEHIATVWTALRRLGLSWKKSPSAPPSRIAPMSPPPAPTGEPGSRRSTRAASCSSTKPEPRRG